MSTKQKIRMPEAAEESAINAGIKADPDSPQWTKVDFARAEPAASVLPRLVGKQAAAEMLKPKRGRPVASHSSVNTTWRGP